jgi:hypothetical protein
MQIRDYPPIVTRAVEAHMKRGVPAGEASDRTWTEATPEERTAVDLWILANQHTEARDASPDQQTRFRFLVNEAMALAQRGTFGQIRLKGRHTFSWMTHDHNLEIWGQVTDADNKLLAQTSGWYRCTDPEQAAKRAEDTYLTHVIEPDAVRVWHYPREVQRDMPRDTEELRRYVRRHFPRYHAVAIVKTTDLGRAYELTNDSWWRNDDVEFLGSVENGMKGARSTSIGDVLEVNGTKYIVAVAGSIVF